MALVALACPLLPAGATAAPAVSFTATTAPIAGFQGSGYALGAGAALRLRYAIAGREYGGLPAPLVGARIGFPRGWRVNTRRFPACPLAMLEGALRDPATCPAGSAAGPPGTLSEVLGSRGRAVRVRARVQAYYAPGGAIDLYVAAQRPVSFWELWVGQPAPGSEATSEPPGLDLRAPLFAASPGAKFTSVLRLEVTIGSAVHAQASEAGAQAGSLYALTVASRCPHGGMPFTSELAFAGVDRLPEQTVRTTYREPCPGRAGAT